MSKLTIDMDQLTWAERTLLEAVLDTLDIRQDDEKSAEPPVVVLFPAVDECRKVSIFDKEIWINKRFTHVSVDVEGDIFAYVKEPEFNGLVWALPTVQENKDREAFVRIGMVKNPTVQMIKTLIILDAE